MEKAARGRGGGGRPKRWWLWLKTQVVLQKARAEGSNSAANCPVERGTNPEKGSGSRAVNRTTQDGTSLEKGTSLEIGSERLACIRDAQGEPA